MEARSLCTILKERSLPLHVKAWTPCTLRDKVVLQQGQEFCVLHTKNVTIIKGENEDGNKFRFSAESCKNQIVDIVERYMPSIPEDLIAADEDIFGTARTEFTHDGITFKKYDSISVTYVAYCATKMARVALVCHKRTNITIIKPDILMRKDLFQFYKVKSVVRFESFLRLFEPVTLRFQNCKNLKTPRGVVHLKSTKTCQLVLTASKILSKKFIRYELYPLNSNVLVNFCDKPLPDFVKYLGESRSQLYHKNIKDIEESLFCDIYGARFYGFLDVEDIACVIDYERITNRKKRSQSELSKLFNLKEDSSGTKSTKNLTRIQDILFQELGPQIYTPALIVCGQMEEICRSHIQK